MQSNSTTEQVPLCACGCGQFVKTNWRGNRWNHFLHGHNGHTPPRTRLCDCGCGTVINLKAGRRDKRFASGHNGRLRTNTDNFWRKVDKTEACWLWCGAQGGHGYGSMSYNGQHYTPSQFSYQLHNGSIPKGYEVLHTCDNPPCVNPSHLTLGTHTDNMRDMTKKGRNGYKAKPERLARGDRHGSRTKPERIMRGERHSKAKLTQQDVDQIRQTYRRGLGRQLAKQFNVSATQISNIVKGKTWRG